ncbi:F-box protein At5g51380-like [Salvia splendens]|uniref:F-box protein At5g51380-like n=1 Tax=Salvia splendens TaxID=180675 RepID=UPI001C263B24|nr:F-box protein At5g51380-like [Salvia splendens]
MSSLPDHNAVFDPNNPGRKRHFSWPEQLSGERFDQNDVLKHVILKLHLRSISHSGSTTPQSESEPDSESLNSSPLSAAPDCSRALSDELLLNVLSRITDRKQHLSNSLVCKAWCLISGRLIQSIKVLDWEFLESGRLSLRFPNLFDVNIVPASINFETNSAILLSCKLLDVYLNSDVLGNDGLFVRRDDILDSERIDRCVKMLAKRCRNLRRIVLMNASEEGLGCLANDCELLQEMELHYCGDLSLKGVCKFRNLQILKLIGRIGGIYDSVVSDIGMTILAQGCGRLVKLELVGCEGSYDGIKAIGMCCQMLEELTLCNHRMEGGWIAALSYCGNLKTLSIQSCKYIDQSPGPDEHLGSCPMLEELHLRRCHMRDKHGVRALFLVCQNIRVLEIEDCWGLDDSIFAAATIFRSIRSVSLEGCSLLTTEGLESVVLSWIEIDRLKVISCSNVKDSEITPELATLFSDLKELKWRPDSRSLLSASLTGTGVGEKGGKSLISK